MSKTDKVVYYDQTEASYCAMFINDLGNRETMTDGTNFAQQYLIHKGLKMFGDRGKAASMKELDQLDKRKCFEPIRVKDLSARERAKAQEALMFLCEKRDNTVKGRMVFNGKPTRQWLSKEDSASPTVSTEGLFITATIDAYEERDVLTADVPNAFIQTDVPPPKPGEDRITMKITGVLVDMLLELNPELYKDFVVYENGQKVLYVVVLKAIYGMLVASLLFYKKFRVDLEGVDFVFNDYDPCVANRMIRGKQQTVRFHVDDVMSSHVDPKVNDEFDKWLNKMYGGYGKVKCVRGKVHDYLGMILDFSETGIVIIDMRRFIRDMITGFPMVLGDKDVAETPAGDNLLKAGTGPLLDKEKREVFHSTTAKGLFVSKRGRPDILPTTSVLCTRVREPRESDWEKLVRLMKYLNNTKEDVVRLGVDDISFSHWFVDLSFAVHPDFKSHIGAVMPQGRGTTISISRKQKLNTRSSTVSEVVGVDDASVVHQDNQSAILLETNGRRSAGQRSRAINVRYFSITDHIEKGDVKVVYCNTDDMYGDYMTKPVQGEKFRKFKEFIMGRKPI
uniref:Reverse transcriptase Ty1/copia-type domain-containing protein n=1 Tax=Grammatophora oceanica TaxID=210454 RepID=A0A7S1V1J3_9STRA